MGAHDAVTMKPVPVRRPAQTQPRRSAPSGVVTTPGQGGGPVPGGERDPLLQDLPVDPGQSRPQALTLSVESTVPGTMVQIDGGELLEVPLTRHPITPGRHQITVSAPGRISWRDSSTFIENWPVTMTFDDETLPPSEAAVVVRASPESSRVFVDGVEVFGYPPTFRGSQGTHRVDVSAPGHLSWRGDVALEAGTVRELTVTLQPHSRTALWVGAAALVGASVAAIAYAVLNRAPAPALPQDPNAASAR